MSEKVIYEIGPTALPQPRYRMEISALVGCGKYQWMVKSEHRWAWVAKFVAFHNAAQHPNSKYRVIDTKPKGK